jgi:hypothetical protein
MGGYIEDIKEMKNQKRYLKMERIHSANLG